MDYELYGFTVSSLWGFLIMKGYKKWENRSRGINSNRLNKWTVIHISKTPKPQKKRWSNYEKECVAKYLKDDVETKDIWNNNEALDIFFAKFRGKAIALTKIVSIKRVNQMDPAQQLELQGKYTFYGVGVENVAVGWIISETETYPLLKPVDVEKGWLQMKRIKNKSLIKSIIQNMDKSVADDLGVGITAPHASMDDIKQTEEQPTTNPPPSIPPQPTSTPPPSIPPQQGSSETSTDSVSNSEKNNNDHQNQIENEEEKIVILPL